MHRLLKRRILTLVLALCLVPCAGLAHMKGFGQYAMDQVNVRRTPGGDILFQKQRGEELYILSWKEHRGHTWYEVNTYDERRVRPLTAWVRADMVTTPEALFADVTQVAADGSLLIALKKDGTVVMGGEMHKYPHLMRGAFPDTWQGVTQVAAGFLTVYGLKEDGSVCQWGLCGPDNGVPGLPDSQGNLQRFKAIDAFDDTFLGLMADGSLYALIENGQSRQVLPPGSGVTAFSAGLDYYDETVVAQGGRVMSIDVFFDSAFSQKERDTLALWENIVQVEAGFRSLPADGHSAARNAALVAGIRADGTVKALDPALDREVSAWSGIISLAFGDGFLVGLRQDGQVLAAGENKHLVAGDIRDWAGITGIACGRSFCAGVTQDGRVLFAGEARFSHH